MAEGLVGCQQKMMHVLVACSAFNEKDGIKRHLISIPQYVHQQTWDGRYKNFDYPCDLSDDGTREIAATFFNVELFDAGGLTEVDKRQKYFDRFNPIAYKFLLVADADEYFMGDWPDFLAELDELYDKYKDGDKPVCIGIDVYYPKYEEYNIRPRIWLNAQNVRMGPQHNAFASKLDGSTLYPIHVVKNMKLNHDYKLRYPSYNERREVYQQKLIEHEGKYPYIPF